MLHWLWELTVGTNQPIWISNLSNLTVFLLLGSAVGIYTHHECREKGCYRLAHHPVEGTTFKTCRPHATVEVHDRLSAEHAKKHPEQHELLNRERKPNGNRSPASR